MEATGDQEGGNNEDLTGKKKPKLKILKSRLFGKAKRKGNEGTMKQSQSASDITEGMRNLEDDFHMLGSRALSHDSIFLADECETDPEPPRVLSQENIHGKIRTLQMKLQQQNMHLGPPPLVLPIKRTEDPGGSSEDDGLPHSPPEILGLPKNMPYKFLIPLRNHSSLSLGGTGSEEEEQSPLQPSSQPVSPRPISSTPTPVSPSEPCPGVDFNTLPQFVPCLDNSAAKHRMSIKPRNQRASTKNRRLPTSAGSRPRSESMNNLERPLTESEEEAAVIKEMTRVRSYSSQIIRPGEVLSTPPTKTPLPVTPLKSLVGAGDGNASRAISHPEGSISGPNISFQHHSMKQQAPAREAASGLKPEAATAAVVTKQAPGSAVPPSKKWSGDLKETPYSSTLKSAQDSTVSPVRSAFSTTRTSTVGSDPNQPQSERRSYTISTHDKRDTLNKDVIMHEDHTRGLFLPVSAGGVPLRPPSLRRNTSPLDEKVVARNLQQISPAHLSSQRNQLQQKSADQQRPMSGSFRFSVSSDRSHERHRTGSFTGVVGQAGAKREPAHDQFESMQAKTTRKDQSFISEYPTYNMRTAITPAVTKPRDPTPTVSAGREQGDSRVSESQEIGVEATEEEVQEEVEEADEASEDLKGNEANEEMKEGEENNAFGVKLRTTSLSLRFRADKAQSELIVKQHSAGVSSLNPPWLIESTAPGADIQKDNSVSQSEPIRGNMAATVFKKSPVHNAEAFISTQVSSSLPQSVSRDKERIAPIKVQDFGSPAQHTSQLAKSTKFVHPLPKESTPVSCTSEESMPVSLPPKGFTPVCTVEGSTPIPTAAKQSQDTSFELSWMSMAREKTRSLQQMFTSRLPDFSSLQTTTRSMNMTGAPPQTQTSTSQPSVGPFQTISSEPPDTQASARATHSAQPPGMQSSIKSSEPTALKSGAADFSLKRTTSQAQTEYSVRAGQLPAATSVQSTAPYTSTPQFYSQTVHTAKHQLSQPLSQAQNQASQGTTRSNLRSSQPTQLSSSPKLSSHQTSQDSGSVLLQSRAQMGGDVSFTPFVKGNWTPVPQGAQWTGRLGGKALHAERWDNQTPDITKVEDQKFTPESRPAPLAAFRAMSSPSKTTESAASSAAMKMDREDKWQKKTAPSSSSPTSSSSPPQSISDSGQPSWMELAKRKSLAWSDKTMD